MAGRGGDAPTLDTARIQRLRSLAAASRSGTQPGVVLEVTEEAWVTTKLAFLLLRFLMGSYRWIVRVLRLMAFVLLLLPALVHICCGYLRAPNILRDVRYGPHPRNYLDIYLPPSRPRRTRPPPTTEGDTEGRRSPLLPVAVFFTGGAWYQTT